MSCPDCTAAATSANWPGYMAGCRGCSVRALANGLEFFKSKKSGQCTPAYRTAVIALLGEDWEAGHREVRAEHQRLQGLRKKPP